MTESAQHLRSTYMCMVYLSCQSLAQSLHRLCLSSASRAIRVASIPQSDALHLKQLLCSHHVRHAALSEHISSSKRLMQWSELRRSHVRGMIQVDIISVVTQMVFDLCLIMLLRPVSESSSHLGEREVTFVCQRCVHQLGCIPLVLPGVLQGCISHLNKHSSTTGSASSVVAQLLDPGPVLRGAGSFTDQHFHNIQMVYHIQNLCQQVLWSHSNAGKAHNDAWDN